MVERLPSNNSENPVYRFGEERSTFGTFPAEEYIRKGQEIKAALERIMADVRGLKSTLEEIEIRISLLEGIRLAVIPRTPIDITNEDSEYLGQTLEPTVMERVQADVMSKEDELGLRIAGQVVGSALRAEFDPLAGHDLLAFSPNPRPGVRQEGGIRLTSSSDNGRSILDFMIY